MFEITLFIFLSTESNSFIPACTADQFTCDNGLCIDRSLLCDANNDCYDLSDEGTPCGEFGHLFSHGLT